MKTPNNTNGVMKRLTTFMPVICTFSILYFYTLLFSNYVCLGTQLKQIFILGKSDPEPERTCTSAIDVCLLAFNTPVHTHTDDLSTYCTNTHCWMALVSHSILYGLFENCWQSTTELIQTGIMIWHCKLSLWVKTQPKKTITSHLLFSFIILAWHLQLQYSAKHLLL